MANVRSGSARALESGSISSIMDQAQALRDTKKTLRRGTIYDKDAMESEIYMAAALFFVWEVEVVEVVHH